MSKLAHEYSSRLLQFAEKLSGQLCNMGPASAGPQGSSEIFLGL
jgi:hypothetical protein